MGMSLIDLTPALRAEYGVGETVEGVLVLAVDPSSDAAGKVRPGDVIVEMGFEEVASIDAARAVGERAEQNNRPLIVRISRDGDLTVRAIRAN